MSDLNKLVNKWRANGGAMEQAADELERALSAQGEAVRHLTDSPEARFEQFVQAEIARSPEPLRELGGYLSYALDEDKFPRANALLLQLATSYTHPAPRVAADEAFEKIAKSWDGCFYDDDLSETSIGDRLRSDWQRLSSAPAPRVEVDEAMVERAAIAISGAPFPSARSKTKARAALTAALNPTNPEADSHG